MPLDIKEPTELLTVQEAAKVLGVIPRRVLQFIKEERLPANKVGRHWFIVRSDLETFKKVSRPSGNKTGLPRTPTPASIAKRKKAKARAKARERAKKRAEKKAKKK